MAADADNLQEKLEDGIKLHRVDGAMEKKPPIATAGTAATKGTEKDDDSLTRAQEQKLLARMRKRFTRCMESEAKNRAEALDDLKFKAGQQWPADIAAQRNFDKRPCLTINKIPTFTRQITNDGRMNRPTINVSPVGGK